MGEVYRLAWLELVIFWIIMLGYFISDKLFKIPLIIIALLLVITLIYLGIKGIIINLKNIKDENKNN